MTDEEKLQEFMAWLKALIERIKSDLRLPG